jgi:hypothetical protein
MHQCGHLAPASVFCVLFPVFCVWRRGWGVGKGTCPLPHRAPREARFFIFAESGGSSGGGTTNGAQGAQGAKLLMPRHRHGLVRPGTARRSEPPCHPDPFRRSSGHAQGGVSPDVAGGHGALCCGDAPWRCTAQPARSFAPLTMTWRFIVFTLKPHCHPDRREGSRRMALEGMAQRTPTNLHCHPDRREGSHRVSPKAMTRYAAATIRGITWRNQRDRSRSLPSNGVKGSR